MCHGKARYTGQFIIAQLLYNGKISGNTTRRDSRWAFHGVGDRWRRGNKTAAIPGFPLVVTSSRLTAAYIHI